MADIVTMPKLGFDMKEGTLVRWVRHEGENVVKGDIVAEIETDKATVEVESGFGGVLRKILVEPGTVVPINAPIALIGSDDEDISIWMAENATSEIPTGHIESEKQIIAEKTGDSKKGASFPISSGVPARIRISPLARLLATERGIPLDKLEGSGPGGRIVRKDLDSNLATPVRQQASRIEEDLKVQPSKLRQIIRRRMVEAKQTIPHFYVTRFFDVKRLLDLRMQMNAALPESDKISINDLVVKATALSLREFPNLNSSLQGEFIVQFADVNIGVAVAVEGGLMTVVCRHADEKSIRTISNEIKQMVSRARSGKVRSEDIEGSTFSISNLGMYEVYEFIAIINPPETAILSLGSAFEEAIVENGTVKPGWRMRATISVDHRVSDGEEAARFMRSLAKYLEQPVRLLID
jgi:pyruvate dehydrogenase E2 component (dihydrolipoamide acetyltransferase)